MSRDGLTSNGDPPPLSRVSGNAVCQFQERREATGYGRDEKDGNGLVVKGGKKKKKERKKGGEARVM